MRRRDVLRLTISGGAAALVNCVAAPQAQSPATLVPPTQTAMPSMTPAPTATVAAPTSPPTPAPTRTPTALPSPTTSPSATPLPSPTSVPSPSPTAVVETPPALSKAVEAALQRGMQADATPGGVVSIRLDDKQILLAAYGLTLKYDAPETLAANPIAATTDTLYDLASITKLFTTTATMRLVEQSRLSLDVPVAQWLSEFAAGGKQDVTLRHLLTHTSGLPADLALWKLESTPQARIQRVLATPLLNPPGKVFRYSDLGLISVGHLLEQVIGAPLERVIHDLVIDPLHMDRVMFRPPAELHAKVAPTEFEIDDPDRGLVWGEVHDESAWSLGGVAGHAGLFGTAEQLGLFGQLYLDGGILHGTRLLRKETVAEMTRNQIPGIEWRGLGWELNARYYMGGLTSESTYGHTGFTGTSLVIEPSRRLVVVLLTNRVHPTRDGPSVNGTRQAVANAALAAAEA